MILYYLSTPYAKYPGGREAAYEESHRVAALLLRNGYHTYSPITHNHPISQHDGFSEYDWLKEDCAYMSRMDAMILYKMPSWERSIGMALEMGHFIAEGKPIFELEYPAMIIASQLKPLERFTSYTIET